MCTEEHTSRVHTGKRERVSLLTQPDGVAGVVVRAMDGEAAHTFVQ